MDFAEAVDAEDEEPEGLAGLPAEALVGVVVGPDVEGGDAFEGIFFGDLYGFVKFGEVGEGDGFGFDAVVGKFDVGLEGGLEEFLLLVLVGGKEEEGGVGGHEFFALFADAAFAEKEELTALLEGGDEGGPFFEGDLAGLWEGCVVVFHGVYVISWGRGSQRERGIFVSGTNGVWGFVPGRRRIRFRRGFIGVRERRLGILGCLRRKFEGFGIRYSFLENFRGGSGGLRRIGVEFGGGVEVGRDVGGCRCFVHVGRLAEGGGFGQGGDGIGAGDGLPSSETFA